MRLPPIDAVRPPFCPHCHAPAGTIGAWNLWGHGTRERDVVIPGEKPALERIWVRRFLCRTCDRTCSVLPAGCLPRHVYTLAAVLMAWFHAVDPPIGEGLPEAEVYARVKVDPGVLAGEPWRQGAPRWRSLRRWTRCAPRWWPTRPGTGTTWRQQAAALLVGFLPGGGGREGATRRAVSAHAAGGTAM